MLTKEDCANLVEFLDRTPIKGHNERVAMNNIVNKIIAISKNQEVTPNAAKAPENT